MVEKKSEKVVAPQGETNKTGADKVAEAASVKAMDEYIASVEKVGEIVRANNATVIGGQPTAGAEAFVAEAAKIADGEVKYTDEGYVIGVDGKNPVSNENPDARCVQGVRN